MGAESEQGLSRNLNIAVQASNGARTPRTVCIWSRSHAVTLTCMCNIDRTLHVRVQGLGEDVTKPKSRLEREKEAAAALRASSDSLPLRKSISNVRSKVGHHTTLTNPVLCDMSQFVARLSVTSASYIDGAHLPLALSATTC